MKKLLISALSILVICLGLLYSRDFIDSSSSGEKQTLTIFNWGEYIDPELIKKFEAETGIKVVYETFDSNEAMLTKIQSGSTPYDLVVPSDYMIKKMKKLDLLKKLDHSKLEGFDNIDKQFINLSFDPNNEYSVPYFWGTLGIVYNKTKVPSDLKFERYVDIISTFDFKNEIYNNLNLKLRGIGYNTDNINENLYLSEDEYQVLSDLVFNKIENVDEDTK